MTSLYSQGDQDFVNAAEQDKNTRWRPSEASVRLAVAALKSSPYADVAAVPMVQPGKTYGWWEIGQQFTTVPGVVFIGANSFDVPDEADVPSYAWARNEAASLARTYLGDAPGTVAWASIREDGTWAVFEDCL